MLGSLVKVKPSGPVTETPLRQAVRAKLEQLAPRMPTLPGFGSVGPFLSLALAKVSDADLQQLIYTAHLELSHLQDVADKGNPFLSNG